MMAPAAPPTTAPMIAPRAVEPVWLPITPPTAAPAAAPIIAPFSLRLREAHDVAETTSAAIATHVTTPFGKRTVVFVLTCPSGDGNSSLPESGRPPCLFRPPSDVSISPEAHPRSRVASLRRVAALRPSCGLPIRRFHRPVMP